MLLENTCLYFFPLVLSAVSTTVWGLARDIDWPLTELQGIDIGQLCSITVTTTSQFLLVIVVVTRCEPRIAQYIATCREADSQVAKDELWNHDTLLLVHFYRNTSTVVEH